MEYKELKAFMSFADKNTCEDSTLQLGVYCADVYLSSKFCKHYHYVDLSRRRYLERLLREHGLRWASCLCAGRLRTLAPESCLLTRGCPVLSSSCWHR
jgi:hypothetical protein